MSPAQVIDIARAARVRIEPRGDILRLHAPEKPPDELLELLRQYKQEILKYLNRGIGPARPPEPHRRCPSCGSGLQPSDPDGELCFTCVWSGAPTRIQ